MFIFSAKAYNVVALAPCAKAALTNETVDPFLLLVDDRKLQAVNSGADQVRKVYGSKEDDEDALRSLSAIEKSESQSEESFATMIVQTLRNPPDDSSITKQQLLNDFLPDDACPLGAPLNMEIPREIDQVGVQDDGEPDKVLETTHQVGRLSVSAASNMPYMEMAGQCEAIQMGKQQKLSAFIVSQQRQENLIRFSNDCSQEKETPSVVPLGAPTIFSLASFCYCNLHCMHIVFWAYSEFPKTIWSCRVEIHSLNRVLFHSTNLLEMAL